MGSIGTGGGSLFSAHQHADPRQKHSGFYWLVDEVIGAHFKSRNMVKIIITGGKHENLTEKLCTDLSTNCQAIFAR
ncbi:Uncharacterised protein [Vibrio cholerae]|nr:Uncharacterised protein [Vibrio cholerae]